MIYLPTDGLSPKELKETKQRIKKMREAEKERVKRFEEYLLETMSEEQIRELTHLDPKKKRKNTP